MAKKTISLVLAAVISFIVYDSAGSVLLNHFYESMKRGREFATKRAIKEITPDILLVGASQCQGNYNSSLMQDSINLEVFNAGMGAQHLEYQIAVLHSVISRSEPKFVLWDFDPKLFSDDNKSWLKTGLNPLYYESEEVKSVLDLYDKHMWIKHLSRSYRYNSLLLEIVNYNLGQQDTLMGYSPFECSYLEMDTIDQESYPTKGNERINKIALFRSMIEELKRRNISVAIVISPIHAYQKEKIWGIVDLERIADDLEIPLFNFSSLESIYDNNNFFRDQIHLCRSGSDVYTRVVIDSVFRNRYNFIR